MSKLFRRYLMTFIILIIPLYFLSCSNELPTVSSGGQEPETSGVTATEDFGSTSATTESSTEAPNTAVETVPETLPKTTVETLPETNPETIPETIPKTEPDVEPTLPVSMNYLTGLPCEESLLGRRAVVIVFNNLQISLPQSGLSRCDIIYEALAEGGILRICGVSLDYENLGLLGSMRSARPYLVELALAYDAIFLHAGGTERAYEAIENFNVDDVDGVKRGPFWANGASVFWRDQDRLNAGIPLEHTMFTSGLKLLDAVNAKGYRKTLNDTSFTAFQFTPYNLPLEGGMTANYIKIPHSTYSVSEFFYHSADGKYYHNQFGDKHVDGQTGEQIATENVMILFTQQSLYPGQTVTSYRKIDLVGEGKGYYANGGEMIPIVWKRSSETGAFSYYREDGTELSVKCGKSYISIADQAIANQIVFS